MTSVERTAAIRATDNFEGVTGPVACDKDGEYGAGRIGVYQVQDGEWVLLGGVQ